MTYNIALKLRIRAGNIYYCQISILDCLLYYEIRKIRYPISPLKYIDDCRHRTNLKYRFKLYPDIICKFI